MNKERLKLIKYMQNHLVHCERNTREAVLTLVISEIGDSVQPYAKDSSCFMGDAISTSTLEEIKKLIIDDLKQNAIQYQ
jgi:hypothetical protein